MTFIQGVSGNFADVDENNHLKVDSVTRKNDNFINGESGKVWSLPFSAVDPVGANDTFLYLKNTGSVPLRITDIRISSTVAGIVHVKQVSGTPAYVGETAISALSRRTSKTPALDATANTDTNITGLTDEGVWFYMTLEASKQGHLQTTSNIILDQGGAMALEWDTATGVLTGVISVVENGI